MERGFNHQWKESKKAKERAWRNLMRESMTEGGRVIINREIEVEEERV
jgi:hypothetical protein